MIKSFHPLLLAACLAGATGVSAQMGLGTQGAAVAAAADPAAESARALLQQAVMASRTDGARVEVTLGAMDPRLALAPCQRVLPYLPAGSRPYGKTRVGLRCEDPGVRWNISLPATVAVWAPGVVLRQALPMGTLLTAAHLQLAEIDWAAESGLAQGEIAPLLGRELARPLAGGAVVLHSDLRIRRWFGVGDTVRVVAQGRGFVVHADGEALSNGIEGQPARIRTSSGRVIIGRPTADRTVEVAL